MPGENHHRAQASVPSRRDPFVRAVMSAWRRLYPPGQRAVVALSAGADSSALLLALAAGLGPARAKLLVACHVVHDLRAPELAERDAQAAQALCQALNVPIVVRRVAVRLSKGNAEAAARAARYTALCEVAREHRCTFVATGHHGHDNLETVLMALLRGSGPGPLGGLQESRTLVRASPHHRPVRLVRPMLTCSPDEARALCTRCGWAWQEDHTNLDASRLRAALRASVLPATLALTNRRGPDAARALIERLVWQGKLLRRAGKLLESHARAVPRMTSPGTTDSPRTLAPTIAWRRETLRALDDAALASVLLAGARELASSRDALGHRQLAPAVRCIRSDSTDPRRLCWKALELTVTARAVELMARHAPSQSPAKPAPESPRKRP